MQTLSLTGQFILPLLIIGVVLVSLVVGSFIFKISIRKRGSDSSTDDDRD